MYRLPAFRLTCIGIILVCAGEVGFAADVAPTATVADVAEAQQWTQLAERLKQGAVATSAQPDGMTAIHWAAFYDNAIAIRQLAAAGANVNAMNDYSVSPLSLACEYGNTAAVEALVELKADVNATRLGKETPLMLAARDGDRRIVRQLIKHGAEIEAQESKKQTALLWAAAAGNEEAVDELLKAGADLSYRLPNSDFSALFFAAREGRSGVVMRLLDAGADVNETIEPKRTGGRNARKGMSAMMLAVESGHLELAIRLIERGADPNDQRSGYTPLHAITWVRRPDRGDQPSGDPSPRITGALHTLDFIRELVKAGANVNLRLRKKASRQPKLNSQGATPFLLAARGADLPLMTLLLELGADPKISNEDGTTALMAAAGVGVTAVGEEPGEPEEVNTAIHTLIELGLDANAIDQNRETAMHGAALRTFPSTVKVLAEVGADPAIWNARNKRGWTPHDIARGKRPGSVKPSPETVQALNEALKESVQPAAKVEKRR